MMKKVLLVTAMSLAFGTAFAADQTLNVDVVIVGGGASGTVAGVSAVEAGLKTVILEKNAFPGGAGNFMEGSFAAESFMQKEAGIKLTKLEAFNRISLAHQCPIG